ncbi:MAG: class I tRNA ligase family protein, partial [Acidimicrobiales bacterium]
MPRFYLTTPIYYVNDVPPVGHAYSTVNADALARWHRMMGDDVFFLTGTDEHGLKVAQSAAANGVSPQEWVDRTAQRFVEAWKQLAISNDDFIRTTDRRHHASVQEFLGKIRDNGYIELGTYEGLYCVSCEQYYTEEELVDGKCPLHGRPVERVKEENYFFKLSEFQSALLDWYEANPQAVQPESKRNEALGFIKQGLQNVSITRTSISWGVPVPWDDRHVFYVWYDALINYIT